LVISVLVATTFAVLYYTKSTPPSPTPAPRTMLTKTPEPRVTPEEEPTPVATPTPLPPTPVPMATPATGFLTLYSSPDNAEVVIDGKVLGRTPLRKHQLPVGTYPVKFVHEGKVSEHTVTIQSGETTEYTHQFTGFASLRIRAIPSGSDVYLNGELAGRSPLLVEGLLPGTYTITIRRTGYATSEKTVVLQKEDHHDVFMTVKRLDFVTDPEASRPTPSPEHPSERQKNSN